LNFNAIFIKLSQFRDLELMYRSDQSS